MFILTPAVSPDAAQWDGVYADGDLAADWGTIHVAADHPLPPVHRVQRLTATANRRPVEILLWPAPGHRGVAYYQTDHAARRRAQRTLRARHKRRV